MVVDDFDIFRTLLGPHKANAPLIVDVDRVLARTINRLAPAKPEMELFTTKLTKSAKL
jgi:hypothetical protein